MTDTPPRILNPESSLVVTYHGTDPYFHQRDPRHQTDPPVSRVACPGFSHP